MKNSSCGLFSRQGFDIAVRNLHKSYRTGSEVIHALDGITWTVSRHQVTVVQGPSGCGKTTLMNILGGVDISDIGSIQSGERLLDANTTHDDLAHFRLNDVGFVFQEYNLIPALSALENLLLLMMVAGLEQRQAETRALALLELVDMRSKAAKRPEELSGGEQQRVAVALALANDPPLVLADEPTGNLDTRNSIIVTDLLCSLAHDFGKTVIITTHDPVVGQRGDSRFSMRDGRLESTGQPVNHLS